MFYSVLEFLQKSSFVLFLFGVGAFSKVWYKYHDKIGYFKYVFGFGALDIMRDNDFKPIENVETKKDRLHNFKEYFVYYNAMAFLILMYAILYIGLFGTILDIVVRLINKGA